MTSRLARQSGWLAAAGVAMLPVLWLTGCSDTQHAKRVGKSGFLDDYSILRKGDPGAKGEDAEALLIYRNPRADWKKYTKVILEPVTLWVGTKGSQLRDVPPEDRRRLGNLLWSKLDENLRKDYEMTSLPGFDTIRIHVALTEATQSDMVMDTVTTAVPPTIVLTGPKELATGVAGFAGSASGEMKIMDAATGELLTAAVDRRGGTKSLGGVTDSWNDVEQAFRYWAEKIRWRLCRNRGGADCVAPTP